MKKILEMRLNPDFAEAPLLQGRIHSSFSRVVNLEFTGENFQPRLITLHSPGFTGLPDSLVVDITCFMELSSLPVGTIVVKEGLNFSFAGLEESLVGDKAHFISDSLSYLLYEPDRTALLKTSEIIKAFRSKRKEQDGFFRLPFSVCQKIIMELRCLCHSLGEGNACEIEKRLLLCTGVGCGLTPSSDDAMIGVLAAAKSGIFGVDLPSMDILKIWNQLEGLTTDISRKYLCCAVEGRFSDVLRNLMKAISDPVEVDLEAHLQAVARIGSTSGMDMLKGIEIAFNEAFEARKNMSLKGEKNEVI